MSTATVERGHPLTKVLLSKVPEVTVYFWIIKVLCTTVGETAADTWVSVLPSRPS